MNHMKEIDNSYQDLLNKVKHLYEDNVNDDTWQDKLQNHVDIRVLYSPEYYLEFQNNVRLNIDKLLSNKLKHDIRSYLEIRKYELNEEIQHLSLGTIGTTLNFMREYYSDIERDIQCHYSIN